MITSLINPFSSRCANGLVRRSLNTILAGFKPALISIFILLFSGCAIMGGTQSSCKVLDPDFAHSIYRGGCKNGLAEGYGEVSGRSSYRGNFHAGKKEGRGIKVMPNGDRYEGEFHNGYREGKGVYIWGKKTPWAGDRYQGEYKHDRRNGWGIYTWNDGDRYEGPWKNDVRMGWSVMEIRRGQAAVTAKKWEKVGVLVCSEARLGSVERRHISGRIERIEGKMIRLRLIIVESGMANFQGRWVKEGDELTDKAVNWHICSAG